MSLEISRRPTRRVFSKATDAGSAPMVTVWGLVVTIQSAGTVSVSSHSVPGASRGVVGDAISAWPSVVVASRVIDATSMSSRVQTSAIEKAASGSIGSEPGVTVVLVTSSEEVVLTNSTVAPASLSIEANRVASVVTNRGSGSSTMVQSVPAGSDGNTRLAVSVTVPLSSMGLFVNGPVQVAVMAKSMVDASIAAGSPLTVLVMVRSPRMRSLVNEAVGRSPSNGISMSTDGAEVSFQPAGTISVMVHVDPGGRSGSTS